MDVFLFFAIFVVVVCDLVIAVAMEDAAKKKGHGKEAHSFAICALFGIFGCLYVVALPDLKQREQLDRIIELLDPQVPATPHQQDVAWKLQSPTPEAPKKDGSAEAFLRELGMSSEEYTCKSLAVFGEAPIGECEMCKKPQKIRKNCGIRRNNAFSDISICTDCINVFTEYNPNSVYNFEAKETK